MSAKRVLVDAGPLVALLSHEDAAHDICAVAAQDLRLPMLTTWVVLAEAAWLLRHDSDGASRLLGLVSNGVIACPEFDAQAPVWMAACLQRYASLRPQLADVSLLWLAQRESITTVFTLDRRDFAVYRTESSSPFDLIPA